MDTRNPPMFVLSIMFGVVSLCCADVVYGELRRVLYSHKIK